MAEVIDFEIVRASERPPLIPAREGIIWYEERSYLDNIFVWWADRQREDIETEISLLVARVDRGECPSAWDLDMVGWTDEEQANEPESEEEIPGGELGRAWRKRYGGDPAVRRLRAWRTGEEVEDVVPVMMVSGRIGETLLAQIAEAKTAAIARWAERI